MSFEAVTDCLPPSPARKLGRAGTGYWDRLTAVCRLAASLASFF